MQAEEAFTWAATAFFGSLSVCIGLLGVWAASAIMYSMYRQVRNMLEGRD